jgi:hypothetical protein
LIFFRGASGGLRCSRGNRCQLEFYLGEIPRPGIETDPAQLRTDASALQIGIRAQMNVTAKHSSTDEGYFDRFLHGFMLSRPFDLARGVPLGQG